MTLTGTGLPTPFGGDLPLKGVTATTLLPGTTDLLPDVLLTACVGVGVGEVSPGVLFCRLPLAAGDVTFCFFTDIGSEFFDFVIMFFEAT